MVFVAFGINHKTAPLAVREAIAFSPEAITQDIKELITSKIAHEAVFLSTCNRTELYCTMDDPSLLLPWFTKKQSIDANTLSPYIYHYENEAAIRHILRVASGLDSMILGEPQILGQLKQAYQTAQSVDAVHHPLRSLFQFIFSASKRIRYKSGIGNNPISMAYAAVSRIKNSFPLLSKKRIFIIGSGETAALVAKYLHQEGAQDFMIASRTEENAEKLSLQFKAKALTITDIPTHLSDADIIISATACPLPFINKKMVEQALLKRHQAPMFFLDLAVPRDIEPDVGTLENVHLYNIDDLHTTIKKGMHERQKAALLAEQLLEDEIELYCQWHRSRRATNIICDYRSQMEALAQGELNRAIQQLNQGNCQYTVVTKLCDRLLNKLLHKPTLGLRQAASDDRHALFELAHYLFGTEEDQKKYEEVT